MSPPLSRCIRTLTRWLTQQETADQIARYDLDLSFVTSNFRFPEQLVSSISRLWRNPIIPQIMEHCGSEFHLSDDAS